MKIFLFFLPCFLFSLYAEIQTTESKNDGGTVLAAEVAGFIRFEEDKESSRLDTAIVHYERDDGIKVSLVGAIHVGDVAYYETLNEKFTRYDEVLYEYVGDPKNLKQEETNTKRNLRMEMIVSMQLAMKNLLELAHQLDVVDYTVKNFVHADMDGETFMKRQKARGQGFFQIWLKSVMAEMNRERVAVVPNPDVPAGPSLVQLLGKMVEGDSIASDLKRFMGREMAQLDRLMETMEGEGGTVIITERNVKAFQVFQDAIDRGVNNLAIFYGAAHLLDMDERLKDLGFHETGREWVTAWEIPSSHWDKK